MNEQALIFYFCAMLEEFKKQARDQRKINRRFLNRLSTRPPRDLDEHFHDLHEAAFEKIDCLDCANCCSTTSPIFIPKDIDRLAQRLRMKPSEFIETYLTVDEDGDYVLRSAPCPFLGDDHYCSVYEDRPRACREYPHTNRRKMHQILDLTYRNTLVCPAVLWIVEQLREKQVGS